MKKGFRILLRLVLIIIILWTLLTVFVELRGPAKSDLIGDGNRVVLIVYDPDPFYNLDEQIAQRVGETMAASGWTAKIYTVAAAWHVPLEEYNFYVFVANTYNWAPDWALARFIQKMDRIKGKPAMAITLGSGSTTRSKKVLEKLLNQRGVQLIGSSTYWLLRPNDEARMDEPNVEVALDMVYQFTQQTVKKIP